MYWDVIMVDGSSCRGMAHGHGFAIGFILFELELRSWNYVCDPTGASAS